MANDAVRRDMGDPGDYDAEGLAVRQKIRDGLKDDRDFNALPWDEKDKVVKRMAVMERERRRKAPQGTAPAGTGKTADGPEKAAPLKTESWLEFATVPYTSQAHLNLNAVVVPELVRVLRESGEKSPHVQTVLRGTYSNILFRMYDLAHPGTTVDDLAGWFDQSWTDVIRQAKMAEE